ncbi:branched-chain amino acid aminotransferase [Pararcticibacter amylolyticus]|uniref:branched-chain-amino-acid transaminase n=1 Tax=Pararcticibacter amylolyticus TaxID=2173175 RepID=A0A2U2PDT1_9SPHI|nr:branched-chain amino acid aminotransferase [Pararcticibacter amylolyticus]PWG79279.1 branched chain amino acid aminotransferase [Pararcticibacter amylolyticus]
MKYPIQLQRSNSSALPSYDFTSINFGPDHTDHLFCADFKDGQWQNAAVKPFSEFSISPLALCLHYGQTVFEGMKAFRLQDGSVSIFRIQKHLERLNRSLQRMCMPDVPEELFINALDKLVSTDQGWVSGLPGNSLYLRPMVFATEARLGVTEAKEYKMMIVALPISNYYNGTVKVKVETEYTRAAKGGAGFAKCGGNYGGAFLPTRLAKEAGFDQVLWTDSETHTFIEESGTMNVMFVIDGTLITPPLSGTILDGVNRDSILTLAKDSGIQTEERPVSYHELEAAFNRNAPVEAFGVGTAAVLTQIGEINILGRSYFPDCSSSGVAIKLRNELQGIRTGLLPDRHHWNYVVSQPDTAQMFNP